MENIGDTLDTGKPQKKYWLRFGIIAVLLPIILSLFLVIMGEGGVIVLLGGFLGFGIPFALDDMGFRGAEGLIFLVPILWFFIGAVIGWAYGLMKKGKYIVAGVILIVVILIAAALSFYFKKEADDRNPWLAIDKAIETRDIKNCDVMEDDYIYICYRKFGEELKDYTICEQSTNEKVFHEKSLKDYCLEAVSLALGECEKISDPDYCYHTLGECEKISDPDYCYHMQSLNIRRLLANKNCSVYGTPREQVLCEQYLKKEITDDDLCKKISNDSYRRDECITDAKDDARDWPIDFNQ